MPLAPLSVLVALVLGAGQEEARPTQPISAPPGRVAELLAGLAPDTHPATLATWPTWSDHSRAAWGGEPVWRRWVELVRAEAGAARPVPARRAELALLARMQGRDGDAWEHLLACAGDAQLVAALLPAFSPGVPVEFLGRPAPLPDGVLLTPALPPCDEARAGLRCLAGKRIEQLGFEVGAARCSLRVSVDGDGLEVSLRHLAGGPARVRVLAPVPRGIDPGLIFADWEKLPDHEGPVEFTLDAEQPEHSLWLTFHPAKESWPSPRLELLARPTAGRELVVSAPEPEERLARFAEALGELVQVPASLRVEGVQAGAGLEPIVLHLGSGPRSERKLLEYLGLAEAFALRAPIR